MKSSDTSRILVFSKAETAASRPHSSDNKKKTKSTRITKEEADRKQREGTWLSPIPQPANPESIITSEIKVPSDSRHRIFIGNFARKLEKIVRENRGAYGEDLKDTFRAKGFIPCSLAPKRIANEDAVERSKKHCPVSIPVDISKEEVFTSLQTDSGAAVAAAMSYSWTEDGLIRQGRFETKGIFLVQVRHHTKLQPFHEMRENVYCVNVKSYGDTPFDLRVMAIVNSEIAFLEAAARAFSGPRDAFQGLPVTDHRGRILIDERIVRKAAYHYSEYQKTLVPGRVYEDANLPDLVRFAHYIVSRSHLPELDFGCNAGGISA